MANKIQLRRDTSANWNLVNPILDDGEPGLNIDNNQIKYGDGSTAWSDLAYAGGSPDRLVKDSYSAILNANGVVTLPSGLEFSSGAQIFEHADNIGASWATGLNIRGSGSNDPIRLYAYGGDSKGYNAAGIVINQHSVDIYGNSLQPSSDGAKWTFGVDGTLNLPQSTVAGNAIVQSTYDIRVNSNGKLWTFDQSGNLTLPTGGEIHSNAGTGNVTLQSNNGSHNFTWNFNTTGSISMPALLSGAQGGGSLDANNNLIALNTNDTVDFHGFSGMILVNSHNGGNVTLYLCGGGTGDAVAIGSSKGSALGSMAFNAGIAGYTFTASESGDHVFFAIRTRTGG